MKKFLAISFFVFALFLFFPSKANAQACGNLNETCCLGDAFQPFKCNNAGLTCNAQKVCVSTGCGDSGQACCTGPMAQPCNNSGLTCTNNKCVSTGCGDAGQACCTGPQTPSCNSTGLLCTNNKCVATSCGAVGQACCTGGTAASCNDVGLTCDNSTSKCRVKTVNDTITGAPPETSSNITCGSDGLSVNTAIGCIPFGNQNELVGFFLRWGLGIGGGIAFILLLLGGFQIMASRGDPNKLKAGQELLTSAIAGLLLLIFSLVILRIIGVDILKVFPAGP